MAIFSCKGVVKQTGIKNIKALPKDIVIEEAPIPIEY